jgi:hypothetical protein
LPTLGVHYPLLFFFLSLFFLSWPGLGAWPPAPPLSLGILLAAPPLHPWALFTHPFLPSGPSLLPHQPTPKLPQPKRQRGDPSRDRACDDRVVSPRSRPRLVSFPRRLVSLPRLLVSFPDTSRPCAPPSTPSRSLLLSPSLVGRRHRLSPAPCPPPPI